jgi:nitric oxide reductase NorQ protein
VREGAICYLDEVVEARKDVTVVLHPLTDDRRILPIDRTGEELEAHPGFMLVALQPRLPEHPEDAETLHPAALRVSLEFTFPVPNTKSPSSPANPAWRRPVQPLVRLAGKLRAPEGQDLEEGVSTRLVVYAPS